MVFHICIIKFYNNYCFSEVIVNFDHEHGRRVDFDSLHPTQYLFDVVSLYIIALYLLFHLNSLLLLNLFCMTHIKSSSMSANSFWEAVQTHPKHKMLPFDHVFSKIISMYVVILDVKYIMLMVIPFSIFRN